MPETFSMQNMPRCSSAPAAEDIIGSTRTQTPRKLCNTTRRFKKPRSKVESDGHDCSIRDQLRPRYRLQVWCLLESRCAFLADPPSAALTLHAQPPQRHSLSATAANTARVLPNGRTVTTRATNVQGCQLHASRLGNHLDAQLVWCVVQSPNHVPNIFVDGPHHDSEVRQDGRAQDAVAAIQLDRHAG